MYPTGSKIRAKTSPERYSSKRGLKKKKKKKRERKGFVVIKKQF